MERKVLRSLVLCAMVGLLFAFVGCSKSNPIIPPDENQTDNGLPRPAAIGESNEWVWGTYTIAISEDHTNAVLVPVRNPSLHLNVTKFVEGPPCPKCLIIGKPVPQLDGTIKIKLWLSHPYPNSPEYTGFDVRGVLIFKATDYFYEFPIDIMDHNKNYLTDKLLLYYSDSSKGGGALLNADGYTFYQNPLFVFPDSPEIFNYYPGKHAYGDPDCTVNPYILFSDGSHRRMFKTTDWIQREYHIKPPEGTGPFELGYVIAACWAPPVNKPVTNPEIDFPVEANCEDPWQVTIEQLQPVSYDVTGQPLFKATLKHRPGTLPLYAGINVPSLSTAPSYDPHSSPIFWHEEEQIWEHVNYIDDETTEIILMIHPISMGNIGNGLVPGYHLGIFWTFAGLMEWGQPPSQLWQPIGVHPVMVYVEI